MTLTRYVRGSLVLVLAVTLLAASPTPEFPGEVMFTPEAQEVFGVDARGTVVPGWGIEKFTRALEAFRSLPEGKRIESALKGQGVNITITVLPQDQMGEGEPTDGRTGVTLRRGRSFFERLLRQKQRPLAILVKINRDHLGLDTKIADTLHHELRHTEIFIENAAKEKQWKQHTALEHGRDPKNKDFLPDLLTRKLSGSVSPPPPESVSPPPPESVSPPPLVSVSPRQQTPTPTPTPTQTTTPAPTPTPTPTPTRFFSPCPSPFTRVPSPAATLGASAAPAGTLAMAGTVFITCPPAPAPTPTVALSFAHTKPGVESELYLDVRAAPGVQVVATVWGPGPAPLGVFAKTDATGRLRVAWVIHELGTYSVSGTVGGAPISAQVEVR